MSADAAFRQFEKTSLLPRLDDAVARAYREVEALPLSDNRRAPALYKVAIYLATRYNAHKAIIHEHHGVKRVNIQDLEDAVKHLKLAEALELSARGPLRPLYLATRADCLLDLWGEKRDVQLLGEAVKHSISAARLISENELPAQQIYWICAKVYVEASDAAQEVEYADEALRYSYKALQVTVSGCKKRAAVLATLSLAHCERFLLLEPREPNDKEKALQAAQDAIREAPLGSSDRDQIFMAWLNVTMKLA